MPPRIKVFFAALILALLFIPSVALFTELRTLSDICTMRPPHGLTSLLIYAATIGALLAVFLVVATGRLAYRGEVSTANSPPR